MTSLRKQFNTIIENNDFEGLKEFFQTKGILNNKRLLLYLAHALDRLPNNKRLIKYILKNYIDNISSDTINTILFHSIFGNYLDIIETVLNKFDNLSTSSISDFINVASEHNNVDIIKYILNNYKVEYFNSSYVIRNAAYYNNIDILKFILNNYTVTDTSLNDAESEAYHMNSLAAIRCLNFYQYLNKNNLNIIKYNNTLILS